MDNRFGFRDLVMVLLGVLMLAMLLLAMKQYDRQFQRIVRIGEELQTQSGEQAQLRREVADLRRVLEDGIKVFPQTGPSTSSNPSSQPANTGMSSQPNYVATDDALARLRQARTQPDFAEGAGVSMPLVPTSPR
ncbi:MAG: hypothetical protein HC898_02505 [Phycisphaerales bacterium]|nr:hypothetical protein [Phycisphaerales bacterium]